MIGQSFSSIYLSWDALCKLTPLYYFDTSGYAFTYPSAWMFGCEVIYTHYPTISLDMISRVCGRSSMYNNGVSIAQRMYGFVGSCRHLAMVNSSWTQSHIEKLWKIPDRTKRVYPPCDTLGLQAHPLQLEAFAVAISKLDTDLQRPKLQLVGSCRNKSDEERLQKLKDRALKLKMDGEVEFYKNLMYRDLVRILGGAVAGIHSMIDENFGLGVVGYMAAGSIPIAHNSAGPKMDIILQGDEQETGFLAQNVQEYADAILKILRTPETERLKMAATARRRAGRSSDERFYDDFKNAIRQILQHSPSN